MIAHEHKSKIVEWGFDKDYNYIAVLYGCTECPEIFTKLPEVAEELPHEHEEYVDGCFACKVRTLELSTGDAGRADRISDKKHTQELSKYREARAQGIQPAGTTSRQIDLAVQASEKLGRAYNAETMPPAQTITREKASTMNELKKAGLE